MGSLASPAPNMGNNTGCKGEHAKSVCGHFQMPLHYPKYSRADYEAMPEWQLDCLLKQYGLPTTGDIHHKRNFAMGAFLWSSY